MSLSSNFTYYTKKIASMKRLPAVPPKFKNRGQAFKSIYSSPSLPLVLVCRLATATDVLSRSIVDNAVSDPIRNAERRFRRCGTIISSTLLHP